MVLIIGLNTPLNCAKCMRRVPVLTFAQSTCTKHLLKVAPVEHIRLIQQCCVPSQAVVNDGGNL